MAGWVGNECISTASGGGDMRGLTHPDRTIVLEEDGISGAISGSLTDRSLAAVSGLVGLGFGLGLWFCGARGVRSQL